MNEISDASSLDRRIPTTFIKLTFQVRSIWGDFQLQENCRLKLEENS